MNDGSKKNLERLFHQARELQGAERREVLDRECANDAGLRSRIEDMLRWDAAPNGWLDNPAASLFRSILRPDIALGRYVIVEAVGAGNMGQVYRAWDPLLKRHVAVKCLPAAFAAHPDRTARLAHEATTLAALNHANIGAIHDFVEQYERQFLILEFVAGPTLAETLRQGPLPVTTVLKIASQIVLALQAAHETGIMHRDLKPANIKIAPGERVKVLDFGLAQALSASDARQDQKPRPASVVEGSPSMSGTVAYMSPEQASAGWADGRTDIWAFGCLLFEMLTGWKAFSGTTASETLTAVRDREPNWNLLPQQTPAGLRALMRQCIEKDPAKRVQDFAALRREIQALEKTARSPKTWIDFFRSKRDFMLPLSDPQARALFVLAQAPYLVGYLIVFHYWDHDGMDKALDLAFNVLPPEVTLRALLLLSLVGLSVRVFFLVLVGWNHDDMGRRFHQIFPGLLVLDGLWAATPLLALSALGPTLSWSSIVLMAGLPFSQRRLILNLDKSKAP